MATDRDRPMNEYEAGLMAGLKAVARALGTEPQLAQPLYWALLEAAEDAATDRRPNTAATIRMILDEVPSFPKD